MALTLVPDETAGQKVGFQDFDGFRRWYSANMRRYKGKNPSPHTLRTKSVHLATSANILGAKDEKYLSKCLCSREDVVYLMDQLHLRMSPGAARQAYYALRSFGEYAKAVRWIPEHYLRPEDLPARNPDKPISVYSPTEMELFVQAARGVDLHWFALLAMLVHTGRRIGETLDLRWEWLRADSKPPYFELPATKNGENQYVPLDHFLRDEVFTPKNVNRMKGRTKFPGHRKEFGPPKDPQVFVFPFGYKGIHGRFRRFCERTGLPNRGFHNFRHTVITTRLAEGMPLQAVSALAGHSSTAITDRRYNHTNALSYAHLLDKDDS